MDLFLEEHKKFLLLLLKHNIETVAQIDFTKPQVMYIGEKPNKIDFLTRIQGIGFEEAFENNPRASAG